NPLIARDCATLVDGPGHAAEAAILGLILPADSQAAIRARIIHSYDLDISVALRQQGIEALAQIFGGVINQHHNGQQRAIGRALDHLQFLASRSGSTASISNTGMPHRCLTSSRSRQESSIKIARRLPAITWLLGLPSSICTMSANSDSASRYSRNVCFGQR